MKLKADEILEMVDDTHSKRAGYRAMADRWEKMWQGEVFTQSDFDAWMKGMEQVVLPVPLNTVNLGMRLISPKPLIEIPSRENTADSDMVSSKLERWLTAMWQVIARAAGQNVTDVAAWQSLTLGRGAFDVKWIKESLPTKLQDREFPILVRNIDPRHMGLERGPYFTQYAFHRYETELWEVMQRYPKQLTGRTRIVREYRAKFQDSDNGWKKEHVTVVDFWYRDAEGEIWNSILMDDEFIIAPYKTLYPDIPIIEFYGDTTGSLEESNKSLSILHALDKVWQYQCRALSQMGTGMLWYFWPFVYATNEMGQIISDLRIEPGRVEQFPAGTDINVVQIQPNMPLAASIMQQLESSIQQATFPSVMYGEAPGDLQAGYGVSLLSDAASGRVGRFMNNLETAIEQVNSLVLGLVQTFADEDEGVEIYGKSDKTTKIYKECLYPKDVEENYYENRVTLKPQLPEDDLQRLTIGSRLVQDGLISARTFRDRWLNVELPEDEENRIFLEQAMKSPELMPKTVLASIIAYNPDTWQDIIRGTPLEQMAVEQGLMPPPPPSPQQQPPGMPGGPPSPPGMPPPPDMPPGMSPGGGPPLPPGAGGMSPGGVLLPPGAGGPMQPDAMATPVGGGIPPQMQGQITPEMLGQPNMPPEIFAALIGRPLPPQEELAAASGLPPGSLP